MLLHVIVSLAVTLCADDIALYRIITNHNDYSALQSDVNSIDSCLSAYFKSKEVLLLVYLFRGSESSQYRHPVCL